MIEHNQGTETTGHELATEVQATVNQGMNGLVDQAREQIVTQEHRFAPVTPEVPCPVEVGQRTDSILRVASGLLVLSDLLVANDVRPEGWAKYKLTDMHGRGYPREAHITQNHQKRFYESATHNRLKDPVWFLCNWVPLGDVKDPRNMKIPKQNYISKSGKVFPVEPRRTVVKLRKIEDPKQQANLSRLRPDGQPKTLVQQLISTVAHYGLRWPDDGPDLTDILGS